MTLRHPRPTSPHLQVYKLPLTGLISITHRITGVLLSAGLLLTIIFFFCLAHGETAYNNLQTIANYWFVKMIFWGFIFALFFHTCHGVRHLIWDVGAGFAPEQLAKLAKLELWLAIGLTITTIIVF